MKGLLFTLLLIAFVTIAATQASAEEHYFTFKVSEPKELQAITRIISIDDVREGTVWAYANDEELAEFERLGYDYELLPHPSSLVDPVMSDVAKDTEAWDYYPTYEAYDSMMYQFAADYPGLCEIINIGYSVEGRVLLYAKISDNVATEENEPEVMYTATMHGDETAGYVLTLRLIDSLLSAYGTDPRVTSMVDNMEIWINPLANPDGTYASGNHTVSGATRYNANSVDLNRNFPDPWNGQHPDGNSWQPETVAMMNIADQQSWVISANYHGGAEVVNYPWDNTATRHADDNWWQYISHLYADTAQYYSSSGYLDGFNDGITNGYDWYVAPGCRQDYMNYWQGCREATLEISNTKLLPASQLPSYWDWNKRSMLTWLEHAMYGIKGIVTDSSTGLPLFATVTVLNHDEDSSRVFTDPDIGDYHRMIYPGTYDVRYSADGYVPKTIYGVEVLDYESVVIQDVELAPVPLEPLIQFVDHDAYTVDAGDTVDMNVTLTNLGLGDATGVSTVLSTSDSYVTMQTGTAFFPDISGSGGTETSQTPFTFVVDPLCPVYHEAWFDLEVTASPGYLDTISFSVTMGREIEDFETGDFSANDWQFGGDQNWGIVNNPTYEGSFAAKSGDISHNDESSMMLTIPDCQSGQIAFYYRVSSESNWDYLRFFVDGVEKDKWSGTVSWTHASFNVTAGTHTFEWRYTKDGSASSGSDCGWVDLIQLPPHTVDTDADDDGVDDALDNCPATYNPNQADTDQDDRGDMCDNCPDVSNPSQADADDDTVGDECDNCPQVANTDQADGDSDTVGDECDNCATVANVDQNDADSDSVGDACDNCPSEANTDQADGDSDTVGDACDNCPADANVDQADGDSDTVGDVCDNCPEVANPEQTDSNSNGVGDACDFLCGDANGDGQGPNVSDLTYLVAYLFGGGPAPVNLEAVDVNGDGQGPNVSDLTYLTAYLFSGGAAPVC
ncbi:hypothetical protein GF356_08495 [candidate division GN15 bacterium]|nr:hypothetical protein [candidate division GN15 bacterium]